MLTPADASLRVAKATLRHHDGPFSIRHIHDPRSSMLSASERKYLAGKPDLLNAVAFSAEFVHRHQRIAQCSCWRLYRYCTVFDEPPFGSLQCKSCASDPEAFKYVHYVKKRLRVYFNSQGIPIDKLYLATIR